MIDGFMPAPQRPATKPRQASGFDPNAVSLIGVQALRQQADFRAALARKPVARHGRFSLHPVFSKLSTGPKQGFTQVVDELTDQASEPAEEMLLGVVVAKRFASKAVTRNMVRRQAREIVRQQLQAPQSAATNPALGYSTPKLAGWVIRTRQQVSVSTTGHIYRSASSAGLKRAVAADLRALLAPIATQSLGSPA